MPQTKITRIAAATEAWLKEPIVNASSKLMNSLAFENMNLPVHTSDWDRMPPFIPEAEQPRWQAMYGDQFGQMASAYVKHKCLQLAKALRLKRFTNDEGLDHVVTGDAFFNIASNMTPAEEAMAWNSSNSQELVANVAKLQQLRLRSGRSPDWKLLCLQSLNPSATWIYPDSMGRIQSGRLVHMAGEGVFPLAISNLVQLKAAGFGWTIYGVSHYISALQWINIKFKLMEALFVSSKRYVTPREWLQIQGPMSAEKAMLPPTNQQMDYAAEILANSDGGIPYALPGGWEWKMLGAEGKMLKVEDLLEKVDNMIRTTSQVSPTFVGGGWEVPAFATSKLQAGVMQKASRPMKDCFQEAYEDQVFGRYCLFNGYFNMDGTVIAPTVEFTTLPIQGDDSIEKKIATLAPIGYISPFTAWEMEGMDPVQEMQRIFDARQGLLEPTNVLPQGWGPGGDPQRFYPQAQNPQGMAAEYKAVGSSGHAKLFNALNVMLRKAREGGDERGLDRAERQIGQYLTQAAFLMRSSMRVTPDNVKDVMAEEKEILLEHNGKGATLQRFGAVLGEAVLDESLAFA